jgi:hypothetical protein
MQSLKAASRQAITFGGIGRDLSRLGVLSILKKHIELADEEILGARKIVSHGHAEREFRVLQHAVYVGYDVLLVDGHRQDLALTVHADYAARGLVGRGDEYRLAGYAVHEDARCRLDVVHVNVAVFRDQVDDVVL